MTLIEILLAFLVMTLGVLGVLAVFPAAMESSKASMEETCAGLIGGSVAHALDLAVKQATYDSTTNEWNAVLSHDLAGGGGTTLYPFTLPKLPNPSAATVWFHHPSMPGSADNDPERNNAFALGGDPWLGATVDHVQSTSDPTDPYRQFLFSFSVARIPTKTHLIYPEPQPNPDKPGQNYVLQDLERMAALFEFRIHVFRAYGSKPGAGMGSVNTDGPGTTTSAGGAEPTVIKHLIATSTVRVQRGR
jgi:hypothetical protein